MKKNVSRALGILFALLLGVLLVRAFAQTRKHPPRQDKEEVVRIPSRVSVRNGETTITLGAGTEAQSGITVASLRAASAREEITTPATVLSVEALVGLRSDWVSAENRLAKARAKLNVSRREYKRLKVLYEDNQNASQKDLQVAEGALRSDAADAAAARQSLALVKAAALEIWGPEVAQWVVDDSPALHSVLEQRRWLVQVTLPADNALAAPSIVWLQISSSVREQAAFVSAFPRVDPRIQGASFLYVLPARQGLAAGANLLAQLGVGKMQRGVLIPQPAIVWWQGNEWVYQQAGRDRFTRRLISGGMPLGNGVFVSQGFSAGDKIVVRGAQALLSEEFRSQIQPED